MQKTNNIPAQSMYWCSSPKFLGAGVLKLGKLNECFQNVDSNSSVAQLVRVPQVRD
jgi:hypothetical protein